ncbi:MAG TPA: YihY/virulence factor BrkB family protein [Solirubrobacterales bacterium]|nr:YihY/virulence factor BrkB family protein [Solirubrobacterales bacterium]
MAERHEGHRRDEPRSPLRLGKRSWGGALKRSAKGFQADNLTDWAAALTYYGVLSIFPALIAIVSIAGLIGSSAIDPMIENVGEVAPGPGREITENALDNLRGSQGAASLALIVSVGIAIWSASAYVAAFMRASNAIYDVEEGRPIWKTLPTRVLVTIVLLVLLIAVAIGITLTGGLAEKVAEPLGLGDTAVAVWEVAKWPVLLLAVSLILALLYWASPNVKHPGFHWLTPGSTVALALWLAVSVAFAFYVANFGSYNKTYGSMAAPIVFLVWLWVSNIAVLLGAELNAELERGREIERGAPAGREPAIEPRDTRKIES